MLPEEIYEFPCPYCSVLIQETKRRGSWKRCPSCNERFKIPPAPLPPADPTPYGLPFAEKVADFLQKEGSIAESHRDYCGMGFFLIDGTFYYSEVYDGYPELLSPESPTHKSFPNRTLFVNWLAEQSDQTLEKRTRVWIESQM